MSHLLNKRKSRDLLQSHSQANTFFWIAAHLKIVDALGKEKMNQRVPSMIERVEVDFQDGVSNEKIGIKVIRA